MEHNILIFYDGVCKEHDHSQELGEMILRLNLREGDFFEALPFTDYWKGEIKERREPKEHNGTMRIDKIKHYLIETWNGTIIHETKIYLSKQ